MEYKEDLYIKAKKLCLCTEAILDKKLYEEELTTSQCYLLYYIWTYHPEGTFTTCLHNELGLSMATLSGSVKRLRKKCYLAVESCAGDERQKKIIPTDKLAQISEELRAAIESAENSIYEKLSEIERKQLLQLEEKALENASNYHKRGGN